MNHKVNATVGFGCNKCGCQDLRSIGACRVDDNSIYFVYQCMNEQCAEQVPFNVDSVLQQLYDKIPMVCSKTVH